MLKYTISGQRTENGIFLERVDMIDSFPLNANLYPSLILHNSFFIF